MKNLVAVIDRAGDVEKKRMKMIDQFIDLVIRPPRAEYNPDQYLWETEFSLAGRKYNRQDLELANRRGHTLQCSHYVPSSFPEGTVLPCVIYCHGNSGCRADANEAAVILLSSNITVFTFDFSGSGISGGDYVSLGWHEKDDLGVVISYLRSQKQISCIGLWGRSMGAVTSLLYGAEDPSIAGMVLDSAFSNLFDLMMELVDVYKIRLPKFTVKMAVQYMRRIIQKKAKFDIMDLNCMQVAPKTFIPALFGHATEDVFIQPHHSDIIVNSYAGDKNVIKFGGDHNSPRPQFYYDSVSIFFYNVLHPPKISTSLSSKLEKYYDLGDLTVGAGTNEEHSNTHDDECCSYSSSNRESWGRCSSLGGSEEDPFSSEYPAKASKRHQMMSLKALATPLRRIQKRKGGPELPKKPKLEKLEAFGQRLRLRILKQVGSGSHRRQRSS